MKKMVLITSILFLMVLQGSAVAGLINATAQPEVAVISTSQDISVPVNIDLGQLPEELGSFTAKLSWDPTVLEFITNTPGASSEFSSLTINKTLINKGQIRFAGVNPHGANGNVNVVNLAFKVIGAAGTSPNINLEFTAMAAAKTFNDLLPYLETISTKVAKVSQLPQEYELEQNYPNPFNPTTRILYSLPERTHISLKIYNSVGQEVITLVDDVKTPGQHAIAWNAKDSLGKNVPAGIYLYKLVTNEFEKTQKMLLVK